jgi:Family of unknown function (DUF5702)
VRNSRSYSKLRFVSYGRQGSITIFLCIILAALVLTESILWTAAARRAAEGDLERSMRLQLQHTLSGWNEEILEYYGLYAVDESRFDSSVLTSCFCDDDTITVLLSPTSEMTAEAIRLGAVRFILMRFPALFASEIISRLSIIGDIVSDSTLYTSITGDGSSDWMSYLETFIGEKDKWVQTIESVLEAVETVDITGTTEKVSSFLQTLQSVAERGGTSFLQQGGEVSDVLDLSKISDVMKSYDRLSRSDLPDFVDNVLLSTYVASFFDSRLVTLQTDDEDRVETNVFGDAFEDLHTVNKPDMEYVVSGVEDENISRYITATMVLDVRFVINLAMNILDKEKNTTALEIAGVLSSIISILSAGTVDIPPEYLKYVVLYIWSIADTFSDGMKLMRGDSVPLFTSKYLEKNSLLQDALDTNYRDYVGIALLLIPNEWKSTRMETIIRRDAGGAMYSGVSVTVQYQDRQYYSEDSYDTYRTT